MKRLINNIAKSMLPYSVRIKLRKLNWKRKYYSFVFFNNTGEKVYCPIAEQEFKCFINKTETVWDSALTATNGAKNRHRLVYLFLKNKTNLFKIKSTLLHVAPEYCLLHKLRTIDTIAYIPGDKMEQGYGKQDGVAYIDLLDLKFDPGSIDYILCSHVLEHIPDDVRAMKEMYKVLKPQGVAIIMVPIDETLKSTYEDFSVVSPTDREKHFGQWDHVRWYGLDIKDRLELAGFNVQIIRYGHEFCDADYKRYGLCDDLIIQACRPE
jgi:SAM-dependent methyltransferase